VGWADLKKYLTILDDQFMKFFGTKAERFFFAPGRVNLIGEHTDYNGGFALPCALNLGTYSAASKRADNKIRLISADFDEPCEITLDDILEKSHNWADYPKGVLAEMLKLGCKIGGFDFYCRGDIPSGAGLASSASVELLTAVTVNELFDCKIPMRELVLLSRRAENDFIGVNCGIMDQYAVAFGKQNHAILLDCLAVKHSDVPLDLGDYLIMITNSNNSRSLAASEYNRRLAECQSALKILQQACKIDHLCELEISAFEECKHLITDQVLLNRATHVIHENARVLQAAEALSAGNLAVFGGLMNESHISLRDLYEVTGMCLDSLAAAAWQVEGVLGSRMTGAGFGGCTVTILHKNGVENFREIVGELYRESTGIEASFYVAGIGAGVVEV